MTRAFRITNLRPFLGPSLAGLIALAPMAGCSSRGDLLASVGGRPITVDDFLAAARSAQDQYSGPADSAKALLLDDLVRRQLMLRHAQDLGWFRDSLVSNFRRLKEQELLTDAMRRQLAPRNIEVSDAEVRQLYAWRDSSAHIQVIYCYTQGLAKAAADEVRRTGDFAAVAHRFNPPGALPPGGDLGEQSSGNLVQPLDGLLRTAPVGKLIGPLEVPGQGWFVARITRRSARPQPPLEPQRAILKEILRQRKQRAVLVRNQQRLRAAYDLQLVPGGSQALFARMNAGANAPPNLPPEQLAQPLARWQTPEGEQYFTMRDAVDELRSGQGERPDPGLLPAIEEWILLQSTNRIEATEARRRMIAQDPDWRRQLDEVVNGYVLDSYYAEEVSAKATPTPDDARAAFERNRSSFGRLDSAKVLVITFPDSASAFGFLQHAGHAGDLRRAAAMVPGSPPVEELGLRFPPPNLEWARQHDAIARMHPGEGAGPFPVHGGWRVYQLESKTQSSPEMSELEPAQRAALDQQAVEMARERRLTELVEQLRGSFPVELHLDRLKRVPWPVPPAPIS
jgi:parvulin-like peptidyl-prolyl isomerase